MRTTARLAFVLAALSLAACSSKGATTFTGDDDASVDTPMTPQDSPPTDDTAPPPDAPSPVDATAPGDATTDVRTDSATTDAPAPDDRPATTDVPTTTDVPATGDAATGDAATTDVTTGDGGACPARTLPSRTGSAIAMGDTSSEAAALEGTCGGESASEATFSWTPPAAGTYTITTAGSDYDTVLYVRDGSCTGAELDCNDDDETGKTLQSSVTVTLRAGQTVVIVVDGYDTETGPFTLNITEGAPDAGAGDADTDL